MLSFVVLLHSTDGTYSDELVAGATTCASALMRSVAGSSPDFIPLVTVLRADPVVGVRYLYTASVPDTNHAVEAGEMLSAPFSPFLAQLKGGTAAAAAATGETEAVDALRGRSLTFLNECILAGTRAAALPRAGDVAGEGACEEGSRTLNTGGKSCAAEVRASTQGETCAALTADPWASLAAGVLTALTSLHKRAAEACDMSAAGNGAVSRDAAVLDRRSVVALFSDCVSDAPLTYSAECAMAVATLAATKNRVAVFGFGKAVDASDCASATPGAVRLQAMAASTGGLCARSISYCVLGRMLDGGGPCEVGEGHQAPSARGRRERIADQYVVCPTVLARVPDRSGVEQVGSEGGGAQAGETGKEYPSHLAWLCPQCMSVVLRYPKEAQGSGGNGDGGPQSENLKEMLCPYCD